MYMCTCVDIANNTYVIVQGVCGKAKRRAAIEVCLLCLSHRKGSCLVVLYYTQTLIFEFHWRVFTPCIIVVQIGDMEFYGTD